MTHKKCSLLSFHPVDCDRKFIVLCHARWSSTVLLYLLDTENKKLVFFFLLKNSIHILVCWMWTAHTKQQTGGKEYWKSAKTDPICMACVIKIVSFTQNCGFFSKSYLTIVEIYVILMYFIGGLSVTWTFSPFHFFLYLTFPIWFHIITFLDLFHYLSALICEHIKVIVPFFYHTRDTSHVHRVLTTRQ